MIEGLGFYSKTRLECGLKKRLEFVRFDLFVFETLFMSVDMCITMLKTGVKL